MPYWRDQGGLGLPGGEPGGSASTAVGVMTAVASAKPRHAARINAFKAVLTDIIASPLVFTCRLRSTHYLPPLVPVDDDPLGGGGLLVVVLPPEPPGGSASAKVDVASKAALPIAPMNAIATMPREVCLRFMADALFLASPPLNSGYR